MEQEGRRTLQLAPGAIELGKFLQWWSLPFAIVTRHSNKQKELAVRAGRYRTDAFKHVF